MPFHFAPQPLRFHPPLVPSASHQHAPAHVSHFTERDASCYLICCLPPLLPVSRVVFSLLATLSWSMATMLWDVASTRGSVGPKTRVFHWSTMLVLLCYFCFCFCFFFFKAFCCSYIFIIPFVCPCLMFLFPSRHLGRA